MRFATLQLILLRFFTSGCGLNDDDDDNNDAADDDFDLACRTSSFQSVGICSAAKYAAPFFVYVY